MLNCIEHNEFLSYHNSCIMTSYVYILHIIYFCNTVKYIVHVVNIYEGGNGAKHRRISPNDATSYFTIRGKSFPI